MSTNKKHIDLEDRALVEKIGEKLLGAMAKGMTLQEATGISNDALEEIYSLAHTFYTQGKYGESLALFQFLAGAAPTSYNYLFGLASSFHQLKNYADAAVGFMFAFSLEGNPLASYFAVDSLLKAERKEDARECIEITLEACADIPEYQELKSKCALIKASLSE